MRSNKLGLTIITAAGILSIALTATAQLKLPSAVGDETALQQRLHMLETAFYPNRPEMVAKMFAKAAMQRNGAVQFMVLAPELRDKFRATLAASHWVTGTTSPQIVSYSAVNTERNDSLWQFAIHFNFEYTAGRPYSCVNHISMKYLTNPAYGKSPVWAITSIDFLDPAQACKPAKP
jgi:hypothetical protein